MNQQLVGVESCRSVPHCSSEVAKRLPLPHYLFNPFPGVSDDDAILFCLHILSATIKGRD